MNNKVELIGWYGGDRAIARAAWTSTQTDVDLKSDEQIRDLIVNKLWNNGTGKPHKTPFERGIVEFNITCDQASHIHLIKHRTLSSNGESARYKELKEDKTYLPDDWHGQDLSDESIENFVNFFGIEHIPDMESLVDWYGFLTWYTKLGNVLYHSSINDLTKTLGRKRAKESCRFFKTYNSQITLSIMINMSCFQNLYTLRADDAAQNEIHEIAKMMLEQIKNIPGEPFKYTLEAFGF